MVRKILVVTNMNQCNINLLDLPNEILIIILQKLNNIDVLYSLFDINNHRLDNMIQENIFISTLNFVLTTLTDDTLSISDLILDRFCQLSFFINTNCSFISL
jgi:hypothetical protein